MIIKKPLISLFIIIVLIHGMAAAQIVRVAAAANLQSVIEVLQKDFKQKTGVTIEIVTGSSGKMVAQITNGAPFDVFLSADTGFPQTLYKAGFASKKPVIYALGSLIICSTQNIDLSNWDTLLLTSGIDKVAIANPAIAPYGKAAEEVLVKKGIIDKVKPKIVYGESISQVNTYIATGVVNAGFTTQAFIKENDNKTKLYYKVIDPKDYSPILQAMVILKHGDNNPDAKKFFQYILSPAAKTIFKAYGYKMR